MAINILGLNATEATLVKNSSPIRSYRLGNQDEIKNRLNQAKENGEVKDLLQLSGVSSLKINNPTNESNPRKTGADYSVDAFFRKDMPKMQNGDGSYSISGVTFTEDELQKARNYMKAAVAELPGGGTLEYADYAKMAIAENSVNSFAKYNFSKEQQDVIAIAMKEYNAGLEELQEQILSKDNVVSNNYGELSDYYGKSIKMDQAMVENINKLKKELSRITGRTYKKSEVGDAPGIISSATNSELISNIKDTFSNVDFNDKDAVNDAMKNYRELVRPAFDASDRLMRNDNSLYDDTNAFTKLIEKMKMSLSATHVDFSV